MIKQHTPTPWEVIEHSWSDSSIYDSNGKCILTVSIYNDATEENQEDLEDEMADKLNAIIHAVNNHDRLVVALEELINGTNILDARVKAKQLLTELKS